jgi:hypothetical protein
MLRPMIHGYDVTTHEYDVVWSTPHQTYRIFAPLHCVILPQSDQNLTYPPIASDATCALSPHLRVIPQFMYHKINLFEFLCPTIRIPTQHSKNYNHATSDVGQKKWRSIPILKNATNSITSLSRSIHRSYQTRRI